MLAATVATADDLVDEAPPVSDVVEVERAAQDQRLVERGLEVAVVSLDRSVLVRLARIAAAGEQAVVGAEVVVALRDVLRRFRVEVAIRGGEAVGAVLAEDPAEGPERVLEVLGQGRTSVASRSIT